MTIKIPPMPTQADYFMPSGYMDWAGYVDAIGAYAQSLARIAQEQADRADAAEKELGGANIGSFLIELASAMGQSGGYVNLATVLDQAQKLAASNTALRARLARLARLAAVPALGVYLTVVEKN